MTRTAANDASSQSIEKSRGGCYAKIRMIAPSGRLATISGLSGGQAHNVPKDRALPERWDKPVEKVPLVVDRAFDVDETRRLVGDLGTTPVVSPKANQKEQGAMGP